MTRVLLAGMSPQVASAVELIVGSVFGAVAIVRHDRAVALTPAALLPHLRPGDLLVLDLMGLGWPVCTPARAHFLHHDLLSTRTGVLMLPPEPAAPNGHGGWAAAVAAGGTAGALNVCVPHPASMTTMRAALLQLHASLQAAAASAAVATTTATTAAAAGPMRTAAPTPTPPPTVTRTALADAAQALRTGPGTIVPALDDWSWPDSRPPFADTQPGATPLCAPASGAATTPAAAAALAAVLAAAAPPPAPAGTAMAPASAAARPGALAMSGSAAPPPRGAPAQPGTAAHPGIPAQAGASPAPAPARATPRPVAPFALTAETYAAIRAACPAVAGNPFLALVFHVVLQGRPLAFHVGRQTGAVFHPAQNWVASNISTALRKRLTQHRLMLEIAEVQPLAEHQVADHARPLYGRRDDGRRALDSFIWALVHHSFDEAPPPVDPALTFHLRRLPNFTRLPAVPDSFVQMALLCLRGPQTVASLRHAYPSVPPDRVGLFVLCALLSGMAVVRPARTRLPPAESVSASSHPAAPQASRPAAAPKRSFIRSLLAKLF